MNFRSPFRARWSRDLRDVVQVLRRPSDSLDLSARYIYWWLCTFLNRVGTFWQNVNLFR